MGNRTNHPPRGRRRLKYCANPQCNKPFEVWLCDLERRRTCSRECAVALRHQGNPGKQTYACAACGQHVERYPSQLRQHVFCSQACRGRYHAEHGRTRPGPKPRPKPIDPTAPAPRPRTAGAWTGLARTTLKPSGKTARWKKEKKS
jgi:hypothetical protein